MRHVLMEVFLIEKVIIMGAAGRDFHNFNVYFKNNPRYRVVCFTATQIPDIEGRRYPPELAGRNEYPQGIPIFSEHNLSDLIREHHIDLVAFSYSDIPHTEVMHKASIAMAHGAGFVLLTPTYTMLKSKKPVVAVCAVRTGCGKSQTTRKIAEIFTSKGKNVVVVRHPMPYGDLKAQEIQRFFSYEDFDAHQCTIEEREEYEPLVDQGIIVYAGIDYKKILKAAESEADIIVWDGGNNDTPFYKPDVHVVLFDPHRAGHERLYYPGETNMIMSDIAIINKVGTAPDEKIDAVRKNIKTYAPRAEMIMAESQIHVKNPERIKGKRVLVVEDGPTLTHGEMSFGAGVIAAEKYGAQKIVDPRPFAHGTLKKAYQRYPHIKSAIPAMGYNKTQIRDLEKTIENAECNLVIFATPMQLPRLLSIRKPSVRVQYTYRDHGKPTLDDVLIKKCKTCGIY